MERKLFCEISPFTYRLSMEKEILKRHIRDLLQNTRFAHERSETALPVLIYRHNSLIRRRLGNVNMQLQENKAQNLALAVKCIDGLILHPGETFSVWRQIGRTTKRKGYKEGTSISYNYIDYRIRNDTGNTFQLRLWVDDEYLCGELRAEQQQPHTFHIHAENEFFSREDGIIYRNGQVFRDTIDRTTGRCLDSQLIRNNHARVMYELPPSITVQEKQQVPK